MIRKKVLIKIGLILATTSCLVVNHHKHKVIKKKYQAYINQEFDRDLKIRQFNFHRQFIKPIEESKKKVELEKIQRQQEAEKQRLEKEKQIALSRGNTIEWIPVRCSFYTNDISDCGKTDGISASGKNLNKGENYCAAPKDIPFGTKLYIEGLDKVYTVQDRGGAITWKDGVMCLDIYIPNASQKYLNKLGVKYSKAKIIK